MFLYVHLFLSADVPDIQEFQRVCLFKVFERTYHKSLSERFSGNNPLETLHTAEKIAVDEFSLADKNCLLQFDFGLFRALEFEWWCLNGLRLCYLPSSTQSVVVQYGEVTGLLRTRCFPREARRIELLFNKLKGTIELDHLPSKLESLRLVRSRLEGPIWLTDLPDSLQTLDLSFNRELGQPAVVYGKLPPSIQKVGLRRTKVRFVRPEENRFMVQEAKIFEGINNQDLLRNALRVVFSNAVEESVIESLLSDDPLQRVSINEPSHVHQTCLIDFNSESAKKLQKAPTLVMFEFAWWKFTGNLQIDFLPHTVERLTVSSCEQTFELHTRCLPRKLLWLDLSRNALVGGIDLPLLPPNISSCNVSSNRLSGRIVMLSLPGILKKLDISQNEDLGQEIVWHTKLPQHIQTIDVSHTRIRTAQPKRKKYRLKEGNVFVGLAELEKIQ